MCVDCAARPRINIVAESDRAMGNDPHGHERIGEVVPLHHW
jgi:hypothetical protein